MRHHILEIGARQLAVADVRIVDLQHVALAEEALGELDERALAQVVGVGLEGETEQPEPAGAGAGDHVVGAVELDLVGGHRSVEHGRGDVDGTRLVAPRPQVLRQAGAAEGEARHQIGRRDVEALVAAQDAHHLVAVDGGALADVTDLVGEAHLEGVPGVVGVLHRLGGGHVDDDRLDADARHQRPELEDRVLVELAEDDGAGIVVVGDRRALAQELGIVGHAEVAPGDATGRPLQGRNHGLDHRAGQDRRTHDDVMALRLGGDGGADLLGDLQHVAGVEGAVQTARRADADDRQLSAVDGFV